MTAEDTSNPQRDLARSRKRSSERWSASFSISVEHPDHTSTASAALDADGLRQALWSATAATFRWRHDGVGASKRFSLPAKLEDAVAFNRDLQQAIVEGWAADTRRRPIPPDRAQPDSVEAPVGMAAAVEPAAAVVEPAANAADLDRGDNVVALRLPRSAGTDLGWLDPGATLAAVSPLVDPTRTAVSAPGVLPIAAAGTWDDLNDVIVPLADIDELVAWRNREQRQTMSKRGKSRAGSTLGNYEGELERSREFFRYDAGDERIAYPDVELNAPMRFDHPAAMTEADCVAFVAARKQMHLRIRRSNESAMRTWAGELESQDREPTGDTLPQPILAPPRLRAEVASPRTVSETCRALRSALSDAQAEGRIATNPWTSRVDRQIERVPQPHFSTRRLASANHVARMAESLAALERSSRLVDGTPAVVTGDRYAELPRLAHSAFLRPEEILALRVSWLVLYGPNPGIAVHGGEVNYPMRFTDAETSRVFVELKARDAGEVRWVPLERDAAADLRLHCERFVLKPDPTSADPERLDPHVFTTHTGAPLDLGNFAERWWKPALANAFTEPGEAHLANMEFRMLRHAGITALLRAGEHYEDVATWAGNSPLVIARHYRGVIDETGSRRGRRADGAPLGDTLSRLAGELVMMSDDDADAHLTSLLSSLSTGAIGALAAALGRRVGATGGDQR